MRLLLIVLLLANLLMSAWNFGWLRAWIGEGREPQGVGPQWNADRLRPVPLSRLDDGANAPAAASARAQPGAATVARPGTRSNAIADPANAAAHSGVDATTPLASTAGARSDTPGACLAFVAIDEGRAAGLRGALEAAGARVEEQRLEQGASYLVYLPPAETLADAQRRLAELHRIGRNDAFLIPDGPYRLGVSLGVFRAESAARAMVSKLAEAGEPGALVAVRAPIQLRVRLEAYWPDADSAAAGAPLAQRFDATPRACD